MCRMIAAVGRIDARLMRSAMADMASNENPAHTHEVRSRGASYQHEDGWGSAWSEAGHLRARRSADSFLRDPLTMEIDDLRTHLLVLHARRATSPDSVGLSNTHPFMAELGGTAWAFCHNGMINDLSPLRAAPGLSPEGTTDSEKLFHHIMAALAETGLTAGGEARPSDDEMKNVILRAIESIESYTALHCFLVAQDRVYATAKRNPSQSRPGYHALWEGRSPLLNLVSSEPVAEFGNMDWRRVEEPGVIVLRADAGRS
jgi:predicted glutamine amidotransferase